MARQKIRSAIILFFFFLFPAIFYYMSPYIIIEATLAQTISGSFIVFGALFVSALILGRAFCGWVCPGAGAQEIIITINNKRITRGNSIKWIIWIPWISAIIILAIKNGGYNKIDPFYQTFFGLSIGDVHALLIYLLVLLLIVLPAFLAGKRAFCHCFCWMAPFMILGRELRNLLRLPSLQLSAKTDGCTHCHLCTTNCPMSLEVEQMVKANQMENSECIFCGSCVDVCKKEVIDYRFWNKSNQC